MWAFLEQPIGAGIAPHVFVPRVAPERPWVLVLTNACIAAALFAIVLVLIEVMRKRHDVRHRWIFYLVGAFFAWRGLMQALSIWTIYHPGYQLEVNFRFVSAITGVATAAALIWILPALHRIPTTAELEREIEIRRRAEDTAREREERLRSFVDSVQDYAMYMIDVNGLVRSWNVGAERIKGYEAIEVVGRHFSFFYTGEEIAAHKPEEALQTATETGRFEGQGWRLRKDGTRFWAHVIIRPVHDDAGAVIGFSKVTRDLTESLALETRYQTLLEAVPDAIVIVATAGRIDFVNGAAERIFGYPRAEMVGQSARMLTPPRVEEVQMGYVAQLLANSPEAEQPGEILGLRRGEVEFPIELSVSPLDTRDGRMVLFVIRDLAERKAAAKLLAEKIDELRHSNEQLEQFAHIASHDLQEPLRMVASYTQLLAKRYRGRLDADADEFIAYAVEGTQRMKQLIEALLEYSRVGKGSAPVRQFPSERVLDQALATLRVRVEETGAVVTRDRLPIITASDEPLAQIFQNLVGNAIKYRGDRAPRIHVSSSATADEWIFSVADNGIGIDPRYFEKIFLIFQRLHSQDEYEGTGIGLAICHRILHQQGGRIWVESRPGQGSTFYFALPIPQCQPALPVPISSPALSMSEVR
jgi:PAS domain S-box-containing protein